MSTPALFLTFSIVRWLTVPVPDEPMVRTPGRALAAATSSPKLFHGRSAFTTSSTVPVVTRVTGARSRSGSKGMERRYRDLFGQRMLAAPGRRGGACYIGRAAWWGKVEN